MFICVGVGRRSQARYVLGAIRGLGLWSYALFYISLTKFCSIVCMIYARIYDCRGLEV